MAFLSFGTVARKKKTLDNLLENILKVCQNDLIPHPKKIKFDSNEEDYKVSKIVYHSKNICQEVSTYEIENFPRKR